MEIRRIGSSDLQASRLGLGTATFGREIDEATSFAVMDYAVDHGITLFDTAEAYGRGQARDYRKSQLNVNDIREVSGEYHSSEKIIGKWLRANGMRKQITLVSKISKTFTRNHLQEALNASLERLQTDYLDVYMFHSFDANTPLEEALDSMDCARRSGHVRVSGCSNFDAAQLRDCLVIAERRGFHRIEIVESICNLAARQAEEDLLPLCRREKLGFLAYSPLGAGFLTGKYSGDRNDFPAGSRFHVIPAHADIYFNERNFEIVRELHRAAESAGLSPVQLAIAWVLAHPDVTSVLCGARTIAHIDNALAAFQFAQEQPIEWPDVLRPQLD